MKRPGIIYTHSGIHATVIPEPLPSSVQINLGYVINTYGHVLNNSRTRNTKITWTKFCECIRATSTVGLRVAVESGFLLQFDTVDRVESIVNLDDYRLPDHLYYSLVVWSELRLTRPSVYSNPDVLGHTDLTARNGHYFQNMAITEAIARMCVQFPEEDFDIQVPGCEAYVPTTNSRQAKESINASTSICSVATA